jgi:NADH dehydrogenase
MTVMVTGASGVVGRAAVRALLARDEVRAVVRRPSDAAFLRELGAKVAVRDLDTPDALAEILPRCHTLVHLVGGFDQPDAGALFGANHGSVLLAIDAAKRAKTKRFVLISVPGADAEATHPFLRAKGLAETAVRDSGLQHAIVRTTHVYGLGGLWFTAAVEGALADTPFVVGRGDQEVAPAYVEDLAAVIAAIDDAPGELAETLGLEGPDVVTADELARLLRGDDVVPTHADGQAAAEALTRLLGVPIDAVAATFLGLPSRADAPDAAAAFGVPRTPFLEGLRATLEAAAAIDTG